MANQLKTDDESDKPTLSEMPMEILEFILMHLDDTHLLTASHVCRSFAAAAELAFARKHFSKHYRYSVYRTVGNEQKSKRSFHQTILNKYGAKIRKISISGNDEHMLRLVERKCCNLTNVKLSDVSRMIAVKNLKQIWVRAIRNLNRRTLGKFINNNRQLEILDINIDANLLGLLDGRLNKLKTLEYARSIGPAVDLPKIRLNALETLSITLPYGESFVRLLHAMDCNPIKSLELKNIDFKNPEIWDEIINAVCAFKTLGSLRLLKSAATTGQMQTLAHHLRDLTEFRIRLVENTAKVENSVHSIVASLPKLQKLEIVLDFNDFLQFANDVKSRIYDFHRRLATYNTEIDVNGYIGSVCTSKDRFYVCEGQSGELHWMNNLNERNVREFMEGVRKCYWLEQIKFVNNCTEAGLDISALMDNDTISLDIESNGPITFKVNPGLYFFFFCLILRKFGPVFYLLQTIVLILKISGIALDQFLSALTKTKTASACTHCAGFA